MCDVLVTTQSNISVSKFALLNSLEHEVSLLAISFKRIAFYY